MKETELGLYIEECCLKNKANHQYPVYSVTNSNGFCRDYFNKDVSSFNKTTYKIVPYGYFAYNPSRINVGSIDWQHYEDNVIVSPLYIVFKCNESLNQKYLNYFFKSNYANHLINSNVSGSVRANLKFDTLSKFKLKVCSVKEQNIIVNNLDKINEAIRAQEKQLMFLDELIKSRFVGQEEFIC